MDKQILFFVLVVLIIMVFCNCFVLASVDDKTVDSHFIEIESISIHYKVWMPTQEPQGKVVLIHGLFGSTFSWRFTAPFLQENGCIVVVIDLPGFGKSDRSRGIDHSQQNRASIIWQLLAKIEENFIDEAIQAKGWDLIGHSMGGGTITAMASERPGLTNTLTYIAGALYNQPPKIALFFLSLPVIDRIFAKVIELTLLTPNRIEAALESAYGRPPTQQEINGYIEPILTDGTAMSFIDITTSQGPPISEAFSDISQPALLMWGEDDSWVSLEEGERLKNDLPNAKLSIIKNSGHCPMETHPQQVNSLLANFLFSSDNYGNNI